ncbi:uncharacterized protein Tco025E_02378 [Trypanosoma conorhini]|uniref:Uncharacterized protein n=1 Tax=Trypanosoma conorhini TaxID=83891 RepID=A0A422Q406_9TRYP|nr:uncharacterized protein Tco025E_02378 [Trypanosoma conorhini]RNF24698.1 hypothetical protein Tco025E_02378 [Trypanosoma conorhini]
MRHDDSKPPVVPRSISCEKPKSILKNTGGAPALTRRSSSSRRRVSFEEDDNFTEPRLRFAAPTDAPLSHGGAAAEDEPALARWEAAPSSRAEVQPRSAADRRASEPASGRERTAAAPLPVSPHDSPIIAPRQPPPASGNCDDKEAARGPVGSEERPPTAVLSRAPAAAAAVAETPCGSEALSPLPEVSVSDITPSPASLVLRLGRSGSGRSSADSCAGTAAAGLSSPLDAREPLFPDVGACAGCPALSLAPAAPEACGRELAVPDGSFSPIFSGRNSPEQKSRGVPVRSSSQHSTWYGGSAEAVVRPPRVRGPTAANASSHSSPLPFEGGVNPADLVFDDSPACSEPAADESDNGVPVALGASHCRRVLAFPVQLYPGLVGPGEPPHNTASPEPSSSNATDDGGEITPQGRRGRRGRRAAWNGDRTPMPLQPVLRATNADRPGECVAARPSPARGPLVAHLNARGAVEEPPELTDGVVRGTGEVLALKENQHPLLRRDQSSAADGASPSALLSCARASSHLPPRRAKPVVVEYINKLSASWQETLRGDLHRRSRSRSSDDACPPRSREEVTRQLFPGVFFGLASMAADAHHANCPAADALGACPLMPIRGTEVVLSKPLKAKKRRGGAELSPTAVVATYSAVAANKGRSGGEKRRVDRAKTPPETRPREEACAEPEEFEEVDSYCVSSTPAANAAPPVVEKVKSGQQQWHPGGKQTTRTPTGLGKGGSCCDSEGARKRRGAETLKGAEMRNEEEEGEERRARRFEKLRRALLLYSAEGASSPPGRPRVAGHDCGCPTAATESTGARGRRERGVPARQKNNLPPSPPSVTAEGLIHTPERAASPGGSEGPPAAQPRILFAPARSVSPPRTFPCNPNANGGENAGGGGVGVLPERRVRNRAAARAFARDITGIVHALRESTWVRML